MKRMTTMNDLRNWVDSATSNWESRTDADIDAIARAIQATDHPAWGRDWSEFLESLPDLADFLVGLPN